MKIDLTSLDQRALWEADELVHAALQLSRKSRTPALDALRRGIRPLSIGKLRQLRAALDEHATVLRGRESAARAVAQARAINRVTQAGWSLRLEHVQCGKEGCTKKHGPYWYGYRSVGGRTRKRYFGKRKPTPKQLSVLGNNDAGELAKGLPKRKARRPH